MLTVTGQNEDISHGLQIGKDQKGDNQRDENGYQFDNIGFIDDISIFADTPEGMHKLVNVVQEFMAWCGVQINAKKTYLLVIDNDKKHREQKPAPLLTINGETLQAMNLDDACRYLGYWDTGNGDMRATKEVVRQKIIAARDLIKCHPLTPQLATELNATRRMLSVVIWTSKCLTALVCAADPVEERKLKEQLSTATSAKHKKTKRCMT